MPESRLPGRRAAMRQLLAVPLACLPPAMVTASQHEKPEEHDDHRWRLLFDGTSFDGWETFLGRPHRSSDVPGTRDARGEYVEPIGVGRDPKGVFSIVSLDGGPAIRVSGEIYGALTTVREFGDYHLRFGFKWGSRKWPQRGELPLDTGCCYHAVGPHGASYGYWMQSCEFQIMVGECGNFYGLAGVKADVDASLQRADYEKPLGEWNTLDLYCAGQQSLHVVNGRRVMKLSRIRRRSGDREEPLQRGRIQLQSEGCEVYFRNLAIRPIYGLPAALTA
jgi:hypothetical protein